MQALASPGSLQVLVVVLAVAVIVLLLALLRRPRPAEPAEPVQPEQPGQGAPIEHNFLAPQQVGLLIEHSAELGPAQLAQELRDSALLSKNDQIGPFFIAPEWIATFPNGDATFSLALLETPRAATSKELIGLVNSLNEQIGSDQSGAVVPRQAVANWLSNAAPNNGPGSPGARPVAVRPGEIDFEQASMLDLLRPFIPAELLEEIAAIEPAAEVQVFVLDTLPCDLDLQQGYDRWSKGFGDRTWPYPPNRIIRDLLQPNGPLRNRHYAGAAHVLQHANFIIPSHDYVMTDHGLFVAAIINALAPRATLQMVEVLNPFGVGSLASIARGFALAAQAIGPQSRVVVNASLALDLPSTNEAWWVEHVQQQHPFWRAFRRDQLAAAADPLGRICALFHAGAPTPAYPYVGVVAAAGNDNTPATPQRPPARLPAAFNGVVGVGAVNHDRKTQAAYSNQADTLPSEAIWAFGGDAGAWPANKQTPATDPNYGIAGPYLGALPDGTPNITGGARWAGTSFAAPIVSGLIAALMSKPGTTFADAERRVRQFLP